MVSRNLFSCNMSGIIYYKNVIDISTYVLNVSILYKIRVMSFLIPRICNNVRTISNMGFHCQQILSQAQLHVSETDVLEQNHYELLGTICETRAV